MTHLPSAGQYRPTRPMFTVLCALLALLALPRPALADSDYPPAIRPLIAQGVQIQDHFDAPGNLTAYLGTMRGQPVALYVTADGRHVVAGTLLDDQGHNLTEQQVQKRLMGPRNQAAWKKLEKSHWVLDGQRDAPVILYVFTDPKCPYCHRFREAAAPWIDAGKVQLRHIIVGILRPDSLPKAATILGDDDPSAALARNQDRYEEGGIEVNDQARRRGRNAALANNDLMRSLGLGGTPSIYYRTSDNGIGLKQGMPPASDMNEVMGGPRP